MLRETAFTLIFKCNVSSNFFHSKPAEKTEDVVIKDETPGAETKEEEKKEDKKEPEPAFEDKKNPSRVLRDQEQFITFTEDQRYSPILKNRRGGFIILEDAKEGEPEEFYDDEEIDPEAPNPGKEDELKIPEAFDFDPAIQSGR